EEEEEEASTWGVEEPLVQSGMAATLALLRNRGDLREELQLSQAGRANDQRDRNINDELQIKDGVKLDYRDEFGRLLTKKEAFRQLSYRFHGHQPGKKKQEKRLKQLKEELSQKKSSVSIKMQSLDRRQKQTKQAHLVLSEGT
ncbi:U4/U6.U5 tri-snRNP-associated protein, partial [Thraustotheca clavata]